jgi:hypothetical protein
VQTIATAQLSIEVQWKIEVLSSGQVRHTIQAKFVNAYCTVGNPAAEGTITFTMPTSDGGFQNGRARLLDGTDWSLVADLPEMYGFAKRRNGVPRRCTVSIKHLEEHAVDRQSLVFETTVMEVGAISSDDHGRKLYSLTPKVEGAGISSVSLTVRVPTIRKWRSLADWSSRLLTGRAMRAIEVIGPAPSAPQWDLNEGEGSLAVHGQRLAPVGMIAYRTIRHRDNLWLLLSIVVVALVGAGGIWTVKQLLAILS